MNENPGGTPSPLNPNPSTAPAGPAPMPGNAQPVAPAGPAPTSQPVPPQQVAQPAPAQPTVAQPQPAPAEPVPVSQQITEQVAELKASDSVVTEPQKKSKKGLIVALVLLLLVAIGGGVAAALMFLKPFGNKDAVPEAIAKLFSNERQKNVSMSGKITMVNNTDSTASDGLASLTIDFNSGVNTVSTEQYVAATVTATFADESTFQFDANEVHTANNDLYLKVSGVAEALDNYNSDSSDEATKCIEDETGETKCEVIPVNCGVDGVNCITPSQASPILEYISVFEAIDDEWIYIPSSTFSNMTGLISPNSQTQCLIDAAGNLGKYNDDFSAIYNNNPFVAYSTDNLKITQKKDQLYLLSFDADKLAGFINAMSTSGFMNDMLACVGGTATNETVTAEDLSDILAELPTIYVEINDQNDFTRVYLATDVEDGAASVAADISLAYPATMSIEEPANYVELNSVLSQLFSGFYNDSESFYDYSDSSIEILDVD